MDMRRRSVETEMAGGSHSVAGVTPAAQGKRTADHATNRSAGFVPSLESIRGLAALTVCLFHIADVRYDVGKLIPDTSLARVLLNGHGAVILFFVLSGFVLRLSLEKARRLPSWTVGAEFSIARLFRLFPIIFVTVLIFTFTVPLLDGRPVSAIEAVKNALLLEITLNGAFWTLQVEIFGSLLILLAFLLERRFGWWIVLVLTLIDLPLSFVGHGHMIKFGNVDAGYLYTFLCGYLVALLPRKPGLPNGVLAALLIASLFSFYGARVENFKQWLLFATVMGAAGLVYVLADEVHQKWLSWAPLRLLGRLSYSFYAFHPLGIALASLFLFRVLGGVMNQWLMAMLVVSLTVVLTISLAIPMYAFVERPGVLLGRRLLARLQLRPPNLNAPHRYAPIVGQQSSPT